MNKVFLIFGYGVPKDILKDEIYNFYLKMVFNKIYDIVITNQIDKPMIITCGGPTDMTKPYKRTEADEMIRFLKSFIKSRSYLKTITKDWIFIPENKSLSTLENLLHSNEMIQERNIKKANVFIFCEQTRERRIKIIANKILNKNFKLCVIPIDFDTTENRYLSQEYLEKKESAELKHSLWALQSSKNLKKHHKIFEEKFEYFRKFGNKRHVNAVKKWWDKKLKELEK